MKFEKMPDINKIREGIDKKNAEMEKKERERIEEEYKTSSEKKEPTEEKPEEKIEEKEKKVEQPILKQPAHRKDITEELTPKNVKAAENVKAAYKRGKFIEVKIKKSSGEIEDGWVINNINPKTQEVTVLKSTSGKGKDKSFVEKIVTLEELKEWNKPETKKSKEKEGKDKEDKKETEKEGLEKEITGRYNDELEKIKQMPDNTGKLKKEKV